MKNSVSGISSKIKVIKESEKGGPNVIRCGTVQEDDKLYNSGSAFEVIGSITLPKGKHLLTLSFLAKATNSLMYFYFQQGQQPCLQNCLLYLPTNNQYIPFTFQKLYVANSQE